MVRRLNSSDKTKSHYVSSFCCHTVEAEKFLNINIEETNDQLFSENEVTIKNIADYMVKVGFLDEVDTTGDCIEVVMESGLPYLISICKYEKHINVGTHFCLEKKQTMLLRHVLKQMMQSGHVFFSMSSIDNEETCVQCIINYEYGLLPKQFISMVKRFESLLKHIEVYVSKHNDLLVPA